LPEVHVLAAGYLAIISLAFPFLGLGVALSSVFQAAGRPLWPLLGITSSALVVAAGQAVHLQLSCDSSFGYCDHHPAESGYLYGYECTISRGHTREKLIKIKQMR
jgi:hypothetical protein